MKWIGITGSWRKTDTNVAGDVRDAVKNIIKTGDGIVTGGALGVDLFATKEALIHDPTAKKIKVILPTSLKVYSEHFNQKAEEGAITHDQANELISLLVNLKKVNPNALIEKSGVPVVDKRAYFNRNVAVVAASNELLAFHVNKTEGVQDTINRAHDEWKKVTVKEYQID
jgi:hypothetical protein